MTERRHLVGGFEKSRFRQHRPNARKGPFETARRSEERLQDHPAVHDERHEETQHAVLGVHTDEHEALDRQDRGGHHCKRRLPVEGISVAIYVSLMFEKLRRRNYAESTIQVYLRIRDA
jgi:hypothetical protein